MQPYNPFGDFYDQQGGDYGVPPWGNLFGPFGGGYTGPERSYPGSVKAISSPKVPSGGKPAPSGGKPLPATQASREVRANPSRQTSEETQGRNPFTYSRGPDEYSKGPPDPYSMGNRGHADFGGAGVGWAREPMMTGWHPAAAGGVLGVAGAGTLEDLIRAALATPPSGPAAPPPGTGAPVGGGAAGMARNQAPQMKGWTGEGDSEVPRGPSGLAPSTEPDSGLMDPRIARGFGPMGQGGTVARQPLPFGGAMPAPAAAKAPVAAPGRSGIAPNTEPPPGSMPPTLPAQRPVPLDVNAWRQLQDAWLFDPAARQRMNVGQGSAAPLQSPGDMIRG